MALDIYYDIKVAVGAAVFSRVTLTTKRYCLTVINSRRNRDIYLLSRFYSLCAVTLGTVSIVYLTCTVTLGTSAYSYRSSEKTVYSFSYLTRSESVCTYLL